MLVITHEYAAKFVGKGYMKLLTVLQEVGMIRGEHRDIFECLVHLTKDKELRESASLLLKALG